MKLNADKITRIVKRKKKGVPSAYIAKQFKVSKRRIEQVWAHHQKHGSPPNLRQQGRRPYRIRTPALERKILGLNEKYGFGATYIGKHMRIKEHTKISNDYIHGILLGKGKAMENKNKQKRRKLWIRYERAHSLSAVHMDWHYNTRLEKWVCAVLDDASRKILSGGEFSKELERHAIRVFDEAFDEYKHIRPIQECITDHGSQFFCNVKNKKGEFSLVKFQKHLDKIGVKHILCRYNHPQTNGKEEKWFDTYERFRPRVRTFGEFAEWYNNRPHGSLDFDTPEQAFWERLSSYVLGRFLSWAEV